MDVRKVSARLVDLLRSFYGKVYQQEERTVLPLLASDVQVKKSMLRGEPPSAVVERATGGYGISPESGTAHVVLAPSFFFRPYNLLCEYPGVRVIIYPLDLSSPQTSPVRELERFFRALSEQTRLKILQMLADREMYLQEIADRLNLTHVTAIHHLAILRAAQLVRVVDRHHVKYYSLRRESLTGISIRMTELLGTETKGRPS
jgi:DNA-binding transcriptional ArsR family regulator